MQGGYVVSHQKLDRAIAWNQTPLLKAVRFHIELFVIT